MTDASESRRHALSGGGEMGQLMRSVDWSETPVGPPASWPQSLRTALSILLETGFPMYIAWGAEFTQFYNDGYRPILGSTKHPAAMGLGTRQTFREIWHIIGPMFEGVMEGGTFSVTDFLLPLDRHGFVEECYFVFSYSPIREEAGNVGGVLVTVFETTERVLGARRLAILRELAAQSQHALSAPAACEIAASMLAKNLADTPFALIYLLDGPNGEPRLAGSSWPAGDVTGRADPHDVAITDARFWPIAEVCVTRQPKVVTFEPDALAGLFASTEWPVPSQAVVRAIFTPGSEQPRAVLVAALSPRLPFDEHYRSFFSLVAGHIGTAIASATALEEAKARAASLAEIDRAKTAFFSNVSHEFRTPLTLLLGPAEDALAAPDELSSEQLERWSVVQRNALRLSKLVNTLLDFARIEAGRVQASYEPVDLTALTAELVSMFRSAIERVGLSLRLELSEITEQAFVDRGMWEKIVLNLLSNALKFTFEGEVGVALHLVGDYFELTVHDTGIGIPSAHLPFIFSRFHRVEGARGRTHEGSGIGLALVAELAKLLGGEVSVQSAEGEGTRFSVRVRRGSTHLPADRIVAPAGVFSTATRSAEPYVVEALGWAVQGPGQALNSAPSDPPALLPMSALEGRARIVLADDNADMRDYLGRLLRERWEVEAVGDGLAALTAVRRKPADLVLMDVMMPGMDGFGFLRALRADPDLRLTPVILLSARAGEEATAQALDAGADDYIVKPFSARELLVRIASKLAVVRVAREARATEDAQRASLYRHFMQAPFPIAVLKGPLHVVELANPWTLQAWGKAPEIVGLPLAVAVPELRGQPFLGWLDEAFKTGIAHEGKEEPAYLPTGPDGALEKLYFNFVYAPLRDAAGVVEGILLSAFVVTEQVLARRALEEALDDVRRERDRAEALATKLSLTTLRLRAAQRTAKIGIFEWSFAAQRMSWSPEIGWLMGVPHDAIATSGRAWLEALVQEDREPTWSAFRKAIEAGDKLLEREVRLRQPSGEPRWVRVSAEVKYDETGIPREVTGAAVDIQVLKEATAVRQRALEEAERTSRAKDEFVATMSHELRTPLNAMLGWAKLLQQKRHDEQKLRHGLAVIERNAEAQARLISDLLDVSRIVSGKLRLTMERLDVSLVVGSALDVVRPAADAKGVQLAMELDPEVGFIVADPNRLQQIVWNLLSNAIKFTPAGGRVTVAARRKAAMVVIDVHDTGLGIEPEHLGSIFDRFHQVDSSATRSQGGLGLGLAIVRHLTEAHGGKVSAHSEGLGKGARFSVVLPLCAVVGDPERFAAGPGDEAREHDRLRSGSPARLRGARILVIDDDADSLELVRVVLEEAGALVVGANSAAAGLGELARQRFALVVSDIGMPDVDGYTFMRTLRARNEPVAALALTAFARAEDAALARSAGFHEHLAKPVDADQLIETIERLLGSNLE